MQDVEEQVIATVREGHVVRDSLLSESVLCGWRQNGTVLRVEVRGGSMLPLIPDKATLTLTCVAPESVRTGDIIVFRHAGGLIAHRVLKVTRDHGKVLFLEKGDSSMSAGMVSGCDLVGVVEEIEWDQGKRYIGGRSGRFLNTIVGRCEFLLYFLHSRGMSLKQEIAGAHPLPYVSPIVEKSIQKLARILPRVFYR